MKIDFTDEELAFIGSEMFPHFFLDYIYPACDRRGVDMAMGIIQKILMPQNKDHTKFLEETRELRKKINACQFNENPRRPN